MQKNNEIRIRREFYLGLMGVRAKKIRLAAGFERSL